MPFDIPLFNQGNALLRRFVPLVAPDYINPRLTFARAQLAGVEATYLGNDGVTYRTAGADVPRFQGTQRRLLLEGQRTNQNSNPRAEGGGGTTMPTGWTPSFGGLAITSVTPTTRNGIPGVALRFAGTPSSTGGQSVQQTGNSDVVAVGTTVVNTVYFELLAGTLTNVSNFALRCNVEAGTTTFTPGAFARVTNVRVTTGTTSSTQFRWQYNDTVTPVDFTLWVGWPMREHATFASTAALPPTASLVASTRNADLLSGGLSGLSIGPGGVGTYAWAGMIPQAAPATVSQTILNISDNTNSNVYFVRNENNGSTIVVRRITGGVASGIFTTGIMTPGTPFAFCGAIDNAGRFSGSFNGGAVVAATGGPTSGLLTYRIGSNATGGESLFGETSRALYLPGIVLSDQMVQAASYALSRQSI